MSTLWRWVFRIFLIIGVVPGVALTGYLIVAHVQVNRAIAETDALDPGWRIADIEAARAKIPDAENSALVIDNGYRQIVKDAWFDKNEILDKFEVFPSVRLTTQEVAAIKEFNDKQAATMQEFRKLSKMPCGRFPVAFDGDISKTGAENSHHSRAAAMALRFDLYGCLEAGDIDGAADRVMCCLNAGRAVGDEPFFVSTLIRIAVNAVTLQGLERFLAQCEADEAKLASLQAELEKVAAEPIFFNGARGERGYTFAMFEQIKTNPGQAKDLGAEPTFRTAILSHLNFFNRAQAALLRHMNRFVALSQTPPETWNEQLDEFDRASKELPIFAELFAGGLTKVARAAQRNCAVLRCMITAVAGERYRVKHGHWPATLDDLVVDKFLDQIPIDPYDGKPLRWKETREGRVVYSVYLNGVDDGGELDRGKPANEVRDIGYELFDPAQRRQAPPE